MKTNRGRFTFIVLSLLLVVGLLASLKSGAVPTSWEDVLSVFGGSGATENDGARRILYNIRLPRIVTGLLAGMNLALSGAILQGILRNPLADPGVIGITSGAGLAAMVIMILFPTLILLVPIGAFAGASAAAFLVYGLSWQGGLNPLRLVLAGVAVAAFFGAFNTVLAVFFPERIQGTVTWMAGGFVGRSWDDVMLILPYTVLGVGAATFAAQPLTLLGLGDDMAKTLGLRVERTRLLLLVLAALLAASAVSVAGMLAFVGLIVPHVTRLIVGGDYEDVLPNAALTGGVLIVFADTIARVIISPAEIPVGVFMSFIGAPFFLYLLKGAGK